MDGQILSSTSGRKTCLTGRGTCQGGRGTALKSTVPSILMCTVPGFLMLI